MVRRAAVAAHGRVERDLRARRRLRRPGGGDVLGFPELRRGWWAVAVLVNPALVEALLLGQLPFMWAAVDADGRRRLLAARPAQDRRSCSPALAQLTHAAVLIPLTALVVVAVRYRDEPNRRALVRGWLISLAIVAAGRRRWCSRHRSRRRTRCSTRAWIEIETRGAAFAGVRRSHGAGRVAALGVRGAPRR